MKTLFQVAKEYEQRKLLKSSRLGEFTLFCYTKDTFYGNDTWDEITLTHRGRLYYKGVPVNEPLRKIFNLNEHHETSLETIEKKMMTQSYEIYDKANGHLFIASAFVDDEGEHQVMFHTKGSLPGEHNNLLNKDIEHFLNQHGNRFAAICSELPVGTYMFEAIVEHDKHALYEEQCEKYSIDQNGFILLGATLMVDVGNDNLDWVECDYETLTMISNAIGTPLIKRYSRSDLDSDIMSWFGHTNIEGYVIAFKDGSRVKIKTDEYWKLRFQNDLRAEKILQMFNSSGFDRIHLKLPEEVAVKCQEVLTEFFDEWYLNDYVYADQLKHVIAHADPKDEETRKTIAKSKEYTVQQKNYIFAELDGKTYDLTRSVHVRNEFIRAMYKSKELMEKLQQRVESIVDSLNT